MAWIRTPSCETRSKSCQRSLGWFLNCFLEPTPAVPYWKVRSTGLGYLAEAAAMGCCEDIMLGCYATGWVLRCL